MNKKDIDSDTSDEDYIPGEADCIQLSEVESDGDPEDDLVAEDDCDNKNTKRKAKKNCKKSKKLKTEDEDKNDDNVQPTQEENKKKADSLWADFLKDTDFKPRATTTASTETLKPSSPASKNKVTKPAPKIFEFAGEKVEIPEVNSVNCTETQSSSQVTSTTSVTSTTPVTASNELFGKRNRVSSGGISSLLNQIGKKQKISTLEKSKLDWDRFKKDENIADEIQAHNKGKNGYLERQDFLQRADLRRFEIEKEARASHRSHRT